MSRSVKMVGLDVGEKRIGVSIADSDTKIAFPAKTIEVDGHEILEIKRILEDESADILVIGYPRNQSGQPTAQTEFVQKFANKLVDAAKNIVFQDESLTSVMAEQQLKQQKQSYKKGDIDAMAATIILQDYIEANYAR